MMTGSNHHGYCIKAQPCLEARNRNSCSWSCSCSSVNSLPTALKRNNAMRKTVLLLTAAMTACSSKPPAGQTEGPLQAGVLETEVSQSSNGMVASDSRLGAEVGAKVLANGGNAVDAAIAT